MNKILKSFMVFLMLFGTICASYPATVIRDTLVDETLKDSVGRDLPPINPMCNFESTVKVPIVLQPMETIRSKNGVSGATINLRVTENVFYRGKLLVPQGTEASAKVETVATQGMNGIPAMIIMDRFEIPGLDPAKMKSYYLKKGLNLTYIVLPVKWALTFLPPTGSLTNFIVGGPAKISPRTKITIYYYPEWECLEKN